MSQKRNLLDASKKQQQRCIDLLDTELVEQIGKILLSLITGKPPVAPVYGYMINN